MQDTERLKFISVTPHLINDYLEMINNHDIKKFLGGEEKQISYDDELKWIKDKLQEKAILFSIIEKETNEFVGNIELMNKTDITAELGISLTANKQNNGYGTEAIKAILDYGFNQLNLEFIHLKVYSNNHHAIKCYKNLGFKEYHYEKETDIIDGEIVDDILMKKTR